MDLTEGIHENITPEIYRKDPAISRSDLLLLDPPARYKWAKECESKETTKALDGGYAFHSMLLEPDLFDTRHVVSTYADFRSKEAREWRDSMLAQGKTVVSKQDRDNLLGMSMSARQHPLFSKMMRSAMRELTVVSKHSGTGLMLKARPDIVPVGNMLVDLKRARDASPRGFGKAVWDLEYGRQAAHYLDVWNAASTVKKEEFIFFAVEPEAPFLCQAYVTPHALIEYGRKINNAALYTLAHCIKTNVFPGYSSEVEEFELPGWALKEIEGALGV